MIGRRLKATLPGTIFKRGRRWWWRVQLPGEPEPKARSLIPAGQRYGVTNRKNAGAVALALWQRAAEREARKRAGEKTRIRAIRRAVLWAQRVRDARQEAEKALARRQAALEKEIEAYRQQAKSWAQRLQQARAEMDQAVTVQKNACARRMRAYKAWAARAQERALARIRADANKTIAEQKSHLERQIRDYKRKTARLWNREADPARPEIEKAQNSPKSGFHRRPENHKKAPGKVRRRKPAGTRRKSTVPALTESTAVQQAASEYAATQAEIRMQSEVELDKIITSIQRMAYCECCFHNGIPEAALNRIDSGHRLCPSCMKALKEKEAEMARLEPLPA